MEDNNLDQSNLNPTSPIPAMTDQAEYTADILVEKNSKTLAIKTTKKKSKKLDILQKAFPNPIWLSLGEAAHIGGVSKKTLQRAVQKKTVKYKVIKERYMIDLASLVIFLHSSKKLENKLNEDGIGQYIRMWR